MPHIKLEYTENIETGTILPLFNHIINILMDNAGVIKKNCKCKAILIPVYKIGSEIDSKHFFHLEISLLKGRSKNVREKIGEKSLQVLQECFMNKNGENVNQFSIEIREINPNDYFTSNTL